MLIDWVNENLVTSTPFIVFWTPHILLGIPDTDVVIPNWYTPPVDDVEAEYAGIPVNIQTPHGNDIVAKSLVVFDVIAPELYVPVTL